MLQLGWASGEERKVHVSFKFPPGLGRNQGWGFWADIKLTTKVSIDIHGMSKCRWDGHLYESDTARGSYGLLKLLGASSTSD